MEKLISDSFENHRLALTLLEQSKNILRDIAAFCKTALAQGGKIILAGNGGSAADAQHIAAELVGRFKKNRPPIAAIAISTNTSNLTAIANDFGFDQIFIRQLESLAQKNDVFIAISTSGKSPNLVHAAAQARRLGIKTIGLLGKDGGDLKNTVDISLTIDIDDTPRIQEMHILAGHIICEIIENGIYGNGQNKNTR